MHVLVITAYWHLSMLWVLQTNQVAVQAIFIKMVLYVVQGVAFNKEKKTGVIHYALMCMTRSGTLLSTANAITCHHTIHVVLVSWQSKPYAYVWLV